MNLDLEKLKIAQAKACLSTNEIVEITKLGRSTVYKIFNGVNSPSIKSAGLIAKALNVDVTELFLSE
ncbi:helix-turn-helix transcriptional regulator [Clostridium botulinum]|uniref:helix-turn-helix transcriptional regulator n=1 Tax=Clostridium botulinum TaxID=1491 RepID=UPI0013FA1AA1|nr:helix-turn-helix transcriptional regulator [Clostridium botulinum]NFN95555.1 helix-turn-helix transcriptional regulator [Clostridium botulinum]NFS97445.1 helix-turn-helix transcriptional regulator [Clostridium botulinum]UZP03352.1 helix-turn-helix transcriptional regulator [Clostridium botulinum]UZP06710.1 helix-turn-helix transcriptional regulator [Clostridium botulinum]UZP10091.1 helix-turn-helix transcriptional regulator [Clostridium botulinum]